MLPNFLVIGAPRSGTTWIARNLREHPEICFSKNKELHFFDREENYQRGIAYYESFFARCENQHAIGEATPDYIHVPIAATRIKEHLPNAKLIVSLRNPIDRVYSRYWNARGKYKENAHLSFEEKLREKPQFIEEGLYFEHLSRYLNLFDRNQLLVLLFDDLKADGAAFMRRIYSFLEVDPEFQWALASQKLSTSASQKRNARSKVLFYMRKASRALRLDRVADSIDKANRVDLPPMDPQTREWLLREHYAAEIERLEELIDRDLGTWRSA